MGNHNYLHVCQSCGNVMATSSTTGPRRCFNCEESMFSLYEPPVDG